MDLVGFGRIRSDLVGFGRILISGKFGWILSGSVGFRQISSDLVGLNCSIFLIIPVDKQNKQFKLVRMLDMFRASDIGVKFFLRMFYLPA